MKKILLSLSALGLAAAVGLSQIKECTLDEMVVLSDDAIYGVITERRSFRVDHPIDGPELYFTTITLEGRSLVSGEPMTVDVTYAGGFVSRDEGVWNSEAPAEDDVRVGNQVVAFYAWFDDMGGEVAGNSLMAAHGGLYRTLAGPRSLTVLGRGKGYAVRRNTRLSDLDVEVTRIHENAERAKK